MDIHLEQSIGIHGIDIMPHKIPVPYQEVFLKN